MQKTSARQAKIHTAKAIVIGGGKNVTGRSQILLQMLFDLGGESKKRRSSVSLTVFWLGLDRP